MKYVSRSRWFSLSALGNGYSDFPLRGWKVTVFINPRDTDVRYNNLDLSQDFSTNPVTVQEWVVKVVLGGNWNPDGSPMMVDDTLRVLAPQAFAGNVPRGLVVIEDLIPEQ